MSRAAAYLPALLLWLFLASCRPGGQADDIDWSVSLDHERTTPYGSSIAYGTVKDYFPAARREALTRLFRYTGVDEHMHGSSDSAALLVMLGLDYFVSSDEWLAVLKFAGAGNEVFLLSSRLDYKIVRSLGCEKIVGGREDYPLSRFSDGSDAEHALQLMPDTARSYGYTGRAIGSYFRLRPLAEADTLFREQAAANSRAEPSEIEMIHAAIDTPAEVLGLTAGRPDFIRYRVGNGHITLHAAPLVLSNYFLLQPGNREYLDAIWHSFPANISAIYWNEYYKRTTEKSSLSVLLKYPATRWALIIALGALLLYMLFGLKRMQRIVPILPPVENASVSFVETVGRLYFNKGDHANLAGKMVQHFLEWVRSHYYLDTSELNEAFAGRLAAKSGKPLAEVDALISRIHELRLGSAAVTPEYLYDLYRSIQSFYKTR